MEEKRKERVEKENEENGVFGWSILVCVCARVYVCVCTYVYVCIYTRKKQQKMFSPLAGEFLCECVYVLMI